jgi:hypothetical protein
MTDDTDLRLSTDRLGFALHQARRGRRVLILLAQARQIRPVLGWLERHIEDRTNERVHWARGLEAYRQVASPGTVELITPGAIERGRLRGGRADLVIVGPGVLMHQVLEEEIALLLLDADPMIDEHDDTPRTPIIREAP